MLKIILLSALTALVLAEDRSLQPRYLEDVPQTRVVGGEEAKPHSWPWQVSLQILSGSSFRHTCGGSLIKPGWIMTAAHCIKRSSTYRVVLGAHNLNKNGGTEQVINVRQVFIHPQWNPNNVVKGFDIALLELPTEATLNDAVKLADLPPPDQILPNKSPCIITGWGRTSTNGPPSNVLKQAPLPSVDQETCTRRDWWGSIIKPILICAGGGHNSGCNGDSGGPLNCRVDGKFYVHGVASFVSNRGCNAFQKPTVFTRVSAYISWINSITG